MYQYEAHFAQRQYSAVDPDNRLVAAERERGWEEKWQALATGQREVEPFNQRPVPTELTPQLRRQFQAVCDQLPAIWATLSNQEKKTMLRSLIQRVNLTRVDADRVALKVVWVSGHYSAFDVQVGARRNDDLAHHDAIIAPVHQLWQQEVDDGTIAAELTTMGYHSARSDRVSAATVRRLRLTHGWYRVNARDHAILAGHLSVLELAELLDVPRFWVYNRIRRGQIAAEYIIRHPEYDRLFVRNEPQLLVKLFDMKENARSQ